MATLLQEKVLSDRELAAYIYRLFLAKSNVPKWKSPSKITFAQIAEEMGKCSLRGEGRVQASVDEISCAIATYFPKSQKYDGSISPASKINLEEQQIEFIYE